jgi:hypothetical protein
MAKFPRIHLDGELPQNHGELPQNHGELPLKN